MDWKMEKSQDMKNGRAGKERDTGEPGNEMK